MTARQMAVGILCRMELEDSYSNLLLHDQLKKSGLSPQDEALVTRLVYGVTERRLTLDDFLRRCARTAPKRWHPTVRAILRTGAYQLLFMDKIPPSAAVNEAVTLTKKLHQPQASGFVNAVLHQLDRQKETMWRELPDTTEGLSVRTSCPLPLLQLWIDAYGRDNALALAQAANETPPAYIRINTQEVTTDAFCERLKRTGVAYERLPRLSDGLHILKPTELKGLAKAADNWYYYQDMASQLCCLALSPQPGERIADVCAAPGGKSFTAALMMGNRGEVWAGDMYAAKCCEMDRRAKELGLTAVHVRPHDATKNFSPEFVGSFDRVICDVPCSGYGVIRRKPEIRYKDPAEMAELPKLQYDILCQAAKLVKLGGVLQYSTCTLNPAENEMVAERFLREHSAFAPRCLPFGQTVTGVEAPPSWRMTLMPHTHGTDGFFMASFQREWA